MRISGKAFVLGAALAAAYPLMSPATAQMSSQTVSFPSGSTGTTVGGTLKGEQIVDYMVNAQAGQAMTVNKSGDAIIYFNVMPPGSTGEADFVGSTSGDNYSGTLSKSGNWTIRVYQMRATARRGESGNYRLAISVTGRPSSGASDHASIGHSGGSAMGSIAGIQGMNAIDAIDVLRERGFENVDSLSSGDTLYGIYYYRPTRLCVQTTSADSVIVDIRDIQTHPKCK
ncbi:hypothetical protein GRI89_10900 [Altererythrobacter salegens]|uniref:Peptidase n=1 Tax=Croceibacterium salegens TaxID=1737568 RepID=A0A6I4SYE0_9SPHN|nr:hypothetical protein [Croceibacterium salegens]MXO60047.1 hypothetical protein [Croceibacterium salegens]